MLTLFFLGAFAVVLHSTGSGVAAAGQLPAHVTTLTAHAAPAGQLVPRRDVFGRLFPVPEIAQSREPRTKALTITPSGLPQKTRVVCGMTIVEANPAIDRKMLLVPREGTALPMRLYPPPECGPVAAGPERK
jgi:hypothetical protein